MPIELKYDGEMIVETRYVEERRFVPEKPKTPKILKPKKKTCLTCGQKKPIESFTGFRCGLCVKLNK